MCYLCCRINYDKKTIHLDLELPHLEIEGDYEISGRILLLPITGKGPFNFKLGKSCDHTSTKCLTNWISEFHYLHYINPLLLSILSKVSPNLSVSRKCLYVQKWINISFFLLFFYLAGFPMLYNIFLRPINLPSFFSAVLCHSNLLLPILFPACSLKHHQSM